MKADNLKILQVVHSHGAGTLERLVIQLSRKLVERGQELAIVFVKEEGADFPRERTEGLKTYILEKKKGFDGQLIGRLRQLILKEGIHLVHTHDAESAVFGTLAAKLSFKPCLHTKHVRGYRHIPDWIYGLNNFVICVSEDIKKDLLSANHVAEKKIQVVYNGIDIEAIDRSLDPAQRKALRQKLGFSDDAFVIGNIARCVKEEDQATLIKALKKMASRELNAQLLIAGEGPLKDELMRIADEYQVASRVKIVNYNGHSSDILNAIDCLILTTFSEGRPFTLLEAMAARKPVIATSIGANTEVIEERKNGYLVPCGFPERIHSAVMRLKAIDSLASEIGEAGRKKVEEGFTLEQMARGYSELYTQV
ncbi:MAG TPA: glycosyltransferase [Candidatus Omnitrophota bacterium]|nr:glycosyltransferase [Candidatus Omnitrophota bacterium]